MPWAWRRDRSLAGRPLELIQEALAIDPKQRKALALAGTAALDAGDFKQAASYWQTLADQLTPGSEEEGQVKAVLAEIRARAAAAGQPLPAPAGAGGSRAATAEAVRCGIGDGLGGDRPGHGREGPGQRHALRLRARRERAAHAARGGARHREPAADEILPRRLAWRWRRT